MNQIIKKVKIIGTGSYVPEKIYTNKFLETLVDTNDKWIFDTLGIRERRIAAPDQATSDLASIAGKRAIENASISPEEIDLIIVCTSTPDRLAPSTACIVQDKLKSYNAVAFDLAAVCSGFLFGLSVGVQFIASGEYNKILVIGADTFSRITDWGKRDCVFFGDGAGAAVLAPSHDESGFISFKLGSDGRGKWNFTIPAGGSEIPASEMTVKNGLHYFQMNGQSVYETGTKVLPHIIELILKDTLLLIKDIDFMIPHQPSIGILKKTAEIIGLPFEKVMTNMDKYANTSGGTIPILLDEVNRSGKLKKSNKILFAAIGSGWTWGASILQW